MAPPKRPSKKSESSSNKPAAIAVGVVALTVAAGAAWYFASGPKVDPQVAALEALGSKLFENRESMSDEQRRAAFSEMRTAYEQLTPEQRDQLRDRRRREWERRENERLKAFFAMSKEEQLKQLDREIDRQEQWRKEREQRRRNGDANQRGGGNRGGGPPGGFAGGPGGGGPGGRGGDGGFGRGGGGDRGGRTGADMNERRQQYLNSTTAEQRARRSEYGRMMRERRQQRGLG
jgi:hypothetical protein